MKKIVLFLAIFGLTVLLQYLSTVSFTFWAVIFTAIFYLIFGIIAAKLDPKIAWLLLLFFPLALIKIGGIIINPTNDYFQYLSVFAVGLMAFMVGFRLSKKNLVFSLSCLVVLVVGLSYFSASVFPSITFDDKEIVLSGEKPIGQNDFGMIHLNGQSFDYKQLKNKVIVLNFTSKSCGVCIQKMPYIAEVVSKYKQNKDVMFFEVVSNIDTIEEAKAQQAKHGMLTSWLYDKNSLIPARTQLEGYPHQVILDKNTIPRFVTKGFGIDERLTFLRDVSKRIDQLLMENVSQKSL